jgi:hypothetical protein
MESRPLSGKGSIVYEAMESKCPVRVPDITHRAGIVPLGPEAQSALALPMLVNKHVVGIFEIQSPVPNAFRDEAVKLLDGLANPMAQMLEDAWLLESGWLVAQTRDALRHLWVDIYLGRSALAEWALTMRDVLVDYTPARRGEVLRQLLLAAIEKLLPPADDNRDTSSRRGYRILQLTYVEEHPVDDITRELHISRRQYFYDLKEALDALADALVRDHQVNLQEQTHTSGGLKG